MAMTIDNSNMNVPKINTTDQKPRLTLKKAFEQAAHESDLLKKIPQKYCKDILAAAQYIVLTKLDS